MTTRVRKLQLIIFFCVVDGRSMNWISCELWEPFLRIWIGEMNEDKKLVKEVLKSH
jgi:hypothetical protein